MTKLYLFSKSVHRFLVAIITTIGLVMALTGILMKYDFIALKLNLNMEMVRYIHNNLSPYFTIIFILMIFTGIVMYLFTFSRNK